ncbi:MAG TPA: metallophosphoesterase [Draconibacterium sp.]|nr:metallophosphoesterase [Draconibacterium sp.]
MFHFYLTLAYIIPNIYVFFRIKSLFISKGYKLWYTLIYLLLAAVYPLSENLSGENGNFFVQMLSIAAGYLLPFYLYIYLSVLLFDLILLFNLFFRIISKELRKSFSFRFYTLSFMIIISVAIVVGGAINLNTIRVSSYQIKVPKRNSHLNNLRVAFVADFHIQQSINPRFVEQFARKVNALKPDIMLYGGDIVEGRDENRIPGAILSTLRKVQTKYGAFGVLGNHESYGSRGNRTFYKKANIKLLRDTILNIDNSFYLAGRNDESFRQRKSVNEILRNISPDLPIILLDHRPTRLQEVSQTPVNVQFSGHTHNGQLFPINYIIHRIYELSWGYEKIRNTHFFVTSGLRLWGPPVKTAGKSEIMLVDFKFK